MPALRPLITALRDPDLLDAIHALGGYDLTDAGRIARHVEHPVGAG